jgi:GNAT superfamily N-acetyltransferase
MNIRQATKSDATELSNLVKSLAHFYFDEQGNELPIWLLKTLTKSAFSKRLSSTDYVNFIYEQNNKIVGYISLKKPNHLYHLFVLEEFQGKGISHALWEYLKIKSEESSFTLRSSIYAVPVYRKFGFRKLGTIGVKDGVSFQLMEFNA